MDRINKILDQNSTHSQYRPCIKAALNAGASLLNNYYDLIDLSDVYRIATVLHPSYKLAYLEKAGWGEEYLSEAQEIVETEFERTYAELEFEEPKASDDTRKASQ
ncbi:hypothetical protein H0H92_007674 [Tricholoma furcatifolium]|nr:hypothetical protein H0H92_007674 [Tricholoma furcatifolium]